MIAQIDVKEEQGPEVQPDRAMGLLYALERDGDEFRAAFYAPNGEPNHLVPEWRDVDRGTFYDLAAQYAGHRDYADVGCSGVIQFYSLASQQEV